MQTTLPEIVRQISPRCCIASIFRLKCSDSKFVESRIGTALVLPDLALKIAGDENETVPEDILDRLFHAAQPRDRLVDFEERLERFLFERTI